MKFTTKITFYFAFWLAIILIAGTVNVYQFSQFKKTLEKGTALSFPSIQHLNRLQTLYYQLHHEEDRFFAARLMNQPYDRSERENLLKKIGEEMSRFSKVMETPETRKLFFKLSRKFLDYRSNQDRLMSSTGPKDLRTIKDRSETYYRETVDLLDRLMAEEREHMRQVQKESGEFLASSLALFLGPFLISVVSIFIGLNSLIRRFTWEANLIEKGHERISKGDYSTPLQTQTFLSEEFKRLAFAFNEMNDKVQADLRHIESAKREWERVFDAVDDLILIHDLDHTVVRVNKTLAQWVGISPQEIVGTNFHELFPHAPHPFGSEKEDIRTNGETEIYLPEKNAYLWITSAPLLDEAGKLTHVIHIARDITEKKKKELEIMNLELETRKKSANLEVLNNLDKAILSSLNIQNLFKTLNSELRTLIGYDSLLVGILQGKEVRTFAYLAGKPIAEFETTLTGTVLERMMTDSSPIIKKDLSKGKIFSEEELLTERGVQSCLMLPLMAKGKVVGSLVIGSKDQEAFSEENLAFMTGIARQVAIGVENATLYQQLEDYAGTLEKKVAERTAELELKNKELEALVRLRSEFISTASHDLRAPLTGVIGFAELFLTGRAGPLTDTQQRYIKTIHDSGNHLLNIIEDFLDVSRMDASRLQINRQEFSVADGIARALGSLSPLFASKNIQLSTEIQQNIPALYADPNRFAQMLSNYLSNALKFTPEGGAVGIKAEQEGGQIRVEVSDTGMGISLEDQEKLFTRFYQAEATRYKIKGSGLGLYIVKQLAELQGGTVGLRSRPKEGSTFWFTLPVFKKAEG